MQLKFTDEQKRDLEKKHYGIVGKHSAVQICDWTKRSLRGEDECYKRWFYGVETFSCAQITPDAMWCDQNCIFCWRPMENMLKKEIKEKVDDPKDIVENVLKQKWKLIVGFKGYKDIDKKKLDAALNEFPSHWAISLSGEPTLYPKLPELIKEIKKHKDVKSVFLVTNGQNPEMIKRLEKENALPTQLYVSLNAFDLASYQKINRGIKKDAWKRLQTSLKLLKSLKTRTVIRLTLIKGINTSKEQLKKLAKLIETSQPDFLEIKAYMHIGYSRKRLDLTNMPTHLETKEYAKQMQPFLLSFKYLDEQRLSRILVYINNGKNRSKPKPKRWIIPPSKWRFKTKRKE